MARVSRLAFVSSQCCGVGRSRGVEVGIRRPTPAAQVETMGSFMQYKIVGAVALARVWNMRIVGVPRGCDHYLSAAAGPRNAIPGLPGTPAARLYSS